MTPPPPLLPTTQSEPDYPPRRGTPLDPKSEDEYLDHQPLISPTHSTHHHTPYPTPNNTATWRRVWLTLGLALACLVGLDLIRSLGRSARSGAALRAEPSTVPRPSASPIIIYKDRVDQTALAKHYGYNPDEKVVVLYVYHDSDDAMANAKFFINHALHDRADFIFILNGPTTLSNRIPTERPNVKVIQRDNSCYDLGAHGEVLQANDRELVKKYDKFILMNASVRGPFMPRWSRDCWTDAFTNRVTDQVKLVGLTMNCLDGVDALDRPGLQSTAEGMDSTHKLRHLQAMMLATDKVGVSLLLDPLGLAACHNNYDIAVASEVRLTMLVEHAGYKVDALMSLFGQSDDFAETCDAPDPMEAYPGGYLPLHETIFAKTKKLSGDVVEQYSNWARNYSSYEYCPQF